MKRLRRQVAVSATVMGVAAALAWTGVRVDAVGAAMAAGFALVVMGWIQDELDHAMGRTPHHYQ
jgi:hypothetical protein